MNVQGFLQILATVSWLAVIGSFVYGAFRASRRMGTGSAVTLIVGTIVAALLLTTAAASVVFIQPEERGVVISALPGDQGVKRQSLDPGLRWVVPFFQNVITYPISRQTYTMSGTPTEGAVLGDDSIRARTNDGQEVFIESSVIFAVDPAQVVNVHIEWQGRYTDELVRPTARGIVRDVASQYGVEEIVSERRSELEEEVTKLMSQKLSENGLILADFVLRDIHFSEEYAAAVEQKQIAEQEAQRAAFIVQQRQQEAEQARQIAQGQADAAVINAKGAAEATVVQAEAQAKALALISEALKDNPELITFRYVEKLAPGVQVMLVPSDAPYLLPFPTTTTTSPTTVAPAAPEPTPEPTTTP